MSGIAELEQDIDALKKEISSLKQRTTGLKKTIRNKKKNTTRLKSKNGTNEVVIEFESLFEQFPQLQELLYGDYSKGTNLKDTQLQLEQEEDEINENKNSDEDVNIDTVTPRKKQRPNPHDDHLPEAEWVLKNQVPLEHQMFDESLIDVMDTRILSSPSKRKANLVDKQKEQNNKRLHDQIILENMFRLSGITYFPLIDPADLRINNEDQTMEIVREMIGIRLDIFNEKSAEFETPFYILLKKRQINKETNSENNNNKSGGRLEIFKHTIPNFIDVERIFVNLNVNSTIDDEDIYIFSKEVYILLLKDNQRRQSIQNLEIIGLISNLKADLRSTKLQFSSNDIKIQLFLDGDNIISCSIIKGIRDIDVRKKWETVLNGPLEDLEYKLRQLQ